MRNIVWLSVCVSMAMSSPVWAEEHVGTKSSKRGWSALIGVANTKIEYEEHDSKIEEPALHIGVGYRMNQFFALDVDLNWIDAEENKSDILLTQTSLSARGVWPVTDSFEAWGKIGLVYGEYKVTHDINPTAKGSATSLVSAIGADYYVTPSIFVRAQYTSHNYEDISGDAVGVSLGYLF